jgi:hypothetical protein
MLRTELVADFPSYKGNPIDLIVGFAWCEEIEVDG